MLNLKTDTQYFGKVKITMKVFSIMKSACAAAAVCALAVMPVNINASEVNADSDAIWKAELLNAIGVSAVCGDEYISRGDFLALAMQTADIWPSADRTSFTDVDLSNDTGRYIAAAEQLGYVSKAADARFNPDRPITQTEASAFCLRILGYENVAELGGGYPNGYAKLAARQRMGSGVSSKPAMTLSCACEMLYNMLNSNYVIESYSQSNEKYAESSDKYMEHLYGLTAVKGTVQALQGISLNTCENASDSEMTVDGITAFNASNADYKYLGRKAECYLRNGSDSEAEFIYARTLRDDDSKIITAGELENVSGFSDNGKNTEISYNDGKKGRAAAVDRDATVIINMEESAELADSDLMIESGALTLNDSDGDGSYDVVIAESISYYYVEGVDNENESFTDKYGKETVYTHEFKHCFIEKDGKTADFKNIGEKTAIGVICSYKDDGCIDTSKRLKLLILGDSVKGIVDGIDSDGAKVYIDGEEFDISDSFTGELYNGYENLFLLGYEGEIIFMEDYNFNSDGAKYGYLVNIGKEKRLDKTLKLKIFTTANKIETFKTSEKILYKGMLGGVYKSGKRLDADDILENVKPRSLIKYAVDENGVISEINTPYDHTGTLDYDGFDKSRFSLDCKSAAGRLYNGIATENYFFSTSSLVFVVPASGEDENQFAVGKQSVYGVNVGGVKLELYDANEKMAPAAAVVTADNGFESLMNYSDFYGETRITIVNKKKNYTDEYGDDRVRLFGMYNRLNVELTARNEELKDSKTTNWKDVPVEYFRDIQPGDILQYRAGMDGSVDLVHILFSFKNNGGAAVYTDDDGAGFTSLLNTTGGKVTKFIPGSYFMLEGSPTRKFLYSQCRNFYIYNLTDNTVKAEKTLDYLDENDYVFVACRRSVVNDVVVFRR